MVKGLVVCFILYGIYILVTSRSTIHGFAGRQFNGLGHWPQAIPLDPSSELKYLELGSHSGSSVINFHKMYGKNPNTRMYCIDPWMDHSDYFEYKGTIENTFLDFKRNIQEHNIEDRVEILRGYSHARLLELNDDFFDLIYIDGNHEPQFVLEDAVLCFRKLKENGYMVFDDVGWGGPRCTSLGITAFLDGYSCSIKVLRHSLNGQCFIQKVKKRNYCIENFHLYLVVFLVLLPGIIKLLR